MRSGVAGSQAHPARKAIPPMLRIDPLRNAKGVVHHFIATASVVSGRSTFLQNAAKRGSAR